MQHCVSLYAKWFNDLCLLLTGIQDSLEQSSSSSQREALSSVTNRFELQEVLKTMDTLNVMVVNLECMQRSIVLHVWLILVLSLSHTSLSFYFLLFSFYFLLSIIVSSLLHILVLWLLHIFFHNSDLWVQQNRKGKNLLMISCVKK